MVSPIATTYAGPSVLPFYAGRFPQAQSAVGGIAILGDALPTGGMSNSTSAVGGSVALADQAASGGLSSNTGLPTWLASAAINEWVAVPNSTYIGSAGQSSPLPGLGAPSALVNAENGTGLDRRNSELWLFGGGHLDWAGNEIVSIVLNTNSPVWQLRRDHSTAANIPTTAVTPDLSRYYDGDPCSRHTYQGTHFIEKLDKHWACGGFTWSHANGNVLEPVTFNKTTGLWDIAGTWNTSFPTSPLAGNGFFAKHPTTEDIYFGVGGGYQFYKLDTTTKVWTLITNSLSGYFPGFECAAIDPARGMFVLTTKGDAGVSHVYAALFSLTTGARTNIAINTSPAWTAFQALSTNHGGVHYNPDQDVYYYCFGGTGQGGRVFKITPNGTTTWDMVEMTMTGVTVPDGVGVANGNILTRFGYVPQMKAIYALPSANSPIYMARVA